VTLKNLFNIKLNMLGTLVIVVLASVTTVIADKWIEAPQFASSAPSLLTAPQAATPLICAKGVYSPVQKTCVDQATFDAEMKRLFAALGLDTSIYEQN
jgi:hypothetical protein